jgi:hypothetical protein
MKIIYNKILPFSGFTAIMLFGVIFVRSEYKPLSLVVLNHEMIHRAQVSDCGGYVWFYLKYLCQCIKYGYRDCPFENEAYENQKNLYYLRNREENDYKNY